MNEGHKVEGCKGRWIDVGTLRDPFKQLCTGCRAARQKPAEDDETIDVAALKEAEDRHMRGLARLKADMEADEAWNRDCVHQDEHGFWFWDETWTVRYGPWATEAEARTQLEGYVKYLDEGPSAVPDAHLLDSAKMLWWLFAIGTGWVLVWLVWNGISAAWRALT